MSTKRNEIDNVSAGTTFESTINKNYKRSRRCCVKSEKTVDLSVMWVDAPKLMIQDGDDKLAKEIHGCAKIIMSESSFESDNYIQILIESQIRQRKYQITKSIRIMCSK